MKKDIKAFLPENLDKLYADEAKSNMHIMAVVQLL